MADKYLKGGALNPAWCDEQDAALMKEEIMDSICNLFDNIDINLDLQLGDAVNVHISNNKELKNNMCTIIEPEKEYEAKFNFIKRHSDTPENKKLAMEIVGLNNFIE